MSNELAPVEYKTESGNAITLSPDDVKTYLTKGNGHVTDSELLIYMQQCKNYKLDPFAHDVHLVKYSDDQPATVIIGKDAFQKRADNNPQYDGMESGVVYVSNGELKRRKGALVVPGDALVGAWAIVYRKDREHPTHVEVSLSEYDTGKSNWKRMPATMIVKVAKAQALREAFPNLFSGLYDESEIADASDNRGRQRRDQPANAEVLDISAPPTPGKQQEFGSKLRELKDMGLSVASVKSWCKEEYGHDIEELNDSEIDDAMEYIDQIMKEAVVEGQTVDIDAGEGSATVDEGNVGWAASCELLDEDIEF